MVFSLRVGRFLGIPVYLHWSFFLAVPLVSLIIGIDLPFYSSFIASILGAPIDMTGILEGFSPYFVGLMVSLGFYASFFFYQTATALVARRRGIRASGITIHIFGGVYSFEGTLTGLRDVLPLALAGPAVHLSLAILAWSMVSAASYVIRNPSIAGIAIILFSYLAIFNLAFCIFSLLPGLPMNGGRILQAWLGQYMPPDRATRISVTGGKIIALLFVLFGVLSLNVILVIIGILIYLGAADEGKRSSPA
jgi:Zn-dependent protease